MLLKSYWPTCLCTGIDILYTLKGYFRCNSQILPLGSISILLIFLSMPTTKIKEFIKTNKNIFELDWTKYIPLLIFKRTTNHFIKLTVFWVPFKIKTGLYNISLNVRLSSFVVYPLNKLQTWNLQVIFIYFNRI